MRFQRNPLFDAQTTGFVGSSLFEPHVRGSTPHDGGKNTSSLLLGKSQIALGG